MMDILVRQLLREWIPHEEEKLNDRVSFFVLDFVLAKLEEYSKSSMNQSFFMSDSLFLAVL